MILLSNNINYRTFSISARRLAVIDLNRKKRNRQRIKAAFLFKRTCGLVNPPVCVQINKKTQLTPLHGLESYSESRTTNNLNNGVFI